MADAVSHVWVRRTQRDARMRAHARAFDHPLHKPRDEGDAYLTYRFWRGIGTVIGSRDDISYLDAILRQDLEPHPGLCGVARRRHGWAKTVSGRVDRVGRVN